MLIQHRKFVGNFHAFLTSYLGPKQKIRRAHIMAELVNFFLGGQKIFDLYFDGKNITTNKAEFNHADEAFHICCTLIKAFTLLHPGFEYHIEKRRVFLIHEKHQPLFNKYLRLDAKKNFAQRSALYGSLMGYPETATTAWRKEKSSQESGLFLLNHCSMQVLLGSLGDIFTLHFMYSKEHWEKEYKAQVKQHVKIYSEFPEIFKYFFLKKNQRYVHAVLANARKKHLFKILNPVEKALFYTCEGNEMSSQEKHTLIYHYYLKMK